MTEIVVVLAIISLLLLSAVFALGALIGVRVQEAAFKLREKHIAERQQELSTLYRRMHDDQEWP